MGAVDRASQRAKRRAVLRWLPAAIVATILIVYLVLIPFGVVHNGNRYGTPEIVVAVGLLIALVLGAQSSLDITELSVGGQGVAAKFEARTQKLEYQVQALQVALTGLVTKYEFVHLVELADDDYPAIKDYNTWFVDELHRLEKVGFVRPTRPNGMNAITRDHESDRTKFDLKDYVSLTSEGRQYLLLRDQVAQNAERAHRQRATELELAPVDPHERVAAAKRAAGLDGRATTARDDDSDDL